MSAATYKLKMLRDVEHSPRTLHWWTDGLGGIKVAPSHVEKYAADLVAAGFFVQKDAFFHITAAGRAQINVPKQMVEPRTWGPASTKGNYTGMRMESPRANANQHLQYRSLTA